MKLAACFLTLLPGFAVAASWTSPGFPTFSEQGMASSLNLPPVNGHYAE